MARCTIHIRGDGPQGTGDGSSYANAYGWVDFIASGDSSTGGNTFMIYGIVEPVSKTGSAVGSVWITPAGAAKQPTIVRGDDATNPCGGIWGGWRVDETFTAQGGGIYNVDLDAAGWNTGLISDAWGFEGSLTTATDYNPLTRKTTEVGLPAGAYFWDSTGKTLWVRLSDGSDPQDKFWIGSSAGHRFVIGTGDQHVILHKIPIYDTYRGLTRVTSDRPKHVRISRCDIWYNHIYAVPLYYAVDNIHFWRCDIGESEQGIYIIAQSPPTKSDHATNCSVQKCYIHDIGYGDRWDGTPPDNSAISPQHLENFTFSRNRGENSYFLFDGWAGGGANTDTPFRQVTIDRNHFQNPHEYYGSTSCGISVSAASSQWTPAAEDSDGIVIRYNVLNGDLGGDVADRGINLGTWPSQVVCEYNLIMNYKNGLQWGAGSALDMDVAHNHNKYRGITEYFIYHDSNNGDDAYAGDNNSYGGTPSGNHFRFNGTEYATLAAAKNASLEGGNST